MPDAAPDAAIVFAFEPRARPSAHDVATRLVDAGVCAVSVRPGGGLELLGNAMTFDLEPFPIGAPKPVFDITADLPSGPVVDPDHAMILRPGPHIKAGERTVPVLREWLSLAARCGGVLPGVLALGWAPARLLSSTDRFARHVSDWEAGGSFPAAVFCGFVPALERALHSVGLRYFIGQELWLEGAFAPGSDVASGFARQVVAYLVHHGRVAASHEFVLPHGEHAHIAPSPNGRLVRVWIDR